MRHRRCRCPFTTLVALVAFSSLVLSADTNHRQRSSAQNMYQGLTNSGDQFRRPGLIDSSNESETEAPPIPTVGATYQFNFDGSECTQYQQDKIIAAWQHAGRIIPTSSEINYGLVKTVVTIYIHHIFFQSPSLILRKLVEYVREVFKRIAKAGPVGAYCEPTNFKGDKEVRAKTKIFLLVTKY